MCRYHHVHKVRGRLLGASALLLPHFVGRFSPGSGMLHFRTTGYLAYLLLADAQASPCEGVGITDAGHFIWIFTWSLGVELWSSGLHGEYFCLLRHLSVLFLSSLSSEWLFKSSSFTCSDYSQEDKSSCY